MKKRRITNPPAKKETSLEKSLTVAYENSLEKIKNLDVDSWAGDLQNYISCEIFCPCEYFKERKRNELKAEDYEKGFNIFFELLKQLHKKTVFTPTPLTFAGFMGITKTTLIRHSTINDERGEVVTMILDRLGENIFQNMLSGKVHPITSIFTAKSLLGYRDNDNQAINILNVNNAPKSVEDILAEYNKNNI